MPFAKLAEGDTVGAYTLGAEIASDPYAVVFACRRGRCVVKAPRHSKAAVEALLRNVVCTAGGSFTFAGTYKHQQMNPPLGAGPVEDMALGLAGLGVVRERGWGYGRFRRACEGRSGADGGEKRELLAEGALWRG